MFALVFMSAFTILAVAGHFFYQLVFGWRSALFEFLFLKIALAQIFFLVSFYIVNPMFTFISFATSWEWGGSVTFFSLFIVLTISARKISNKIGTEANDCGVHFFHYLTAIIIFGIIAKVASFYSISAGALGSDTHQHIYWTNHIVDLGYLPLVARGTGIVELYAKGLHVLTAIWASLGFQQMTGSFLKMMPFIQNILPLAIVIEVLTQRKRSFSVKNLILAIGVAILVTNLTFNGLRLYYPNLDLNSTGRLSGAFVTVLPIVLAFASLFASNGRMRFVFLVCFLFPVFGAFSVAINPSLIVAYLLFTCPITLILVVSQFPSLAGRRLMIGLLFVLGSMVSVAIVLQDPYLLSFVNKVEKGRIVEDALDSIDIKTDEEATASGLKADVEFQIQETAQSDVCQDRVCYFRRLRGAFEATPWKDMRALVKIGAFSSNSFVSEWWRRYYYPILWGLFSIFALVMVLRRFKEKRIDVDGIKIAFLLGLIFGFLLLHQLAATYLRATIANDNISFVLLQQYATSYVSFLSLPLAAMVLVAVCIGSWNLVVPVKDSFKQFNWIQPWGVGFCLGALLAVAVWKERPAELDPMKGFWNPVTRREIHGFRNLERNIPLSDKIIVPAQYVQMGNEHWLFPEGETTKYLPFGRNTYVFNLRLGEGYRYDWRDFRNKFCNPDSSVRKKFIGQENLKWLLIAGADVASETFFNRSSICQISIKDFGAVFPPVFVKSGKIAYFRIDPSRIP